MDRYGSLQICNENEQMYNQYRPPASFGGPPGGFGAGGGFGPPSFPPAPAYSQQQYGGSGFGGGPSQASSQAPDDKLSKGEGLLSAVRWLKTRSPREKLVLGCIAGIVVSSLAWTKNAA